MIKVKYALQHFLKHDLLIAKLHAFGFEYKTLRVMCAYLNNRVQVTKAGSYFSEILGIIFHKQPTRGVPRKRCS